MSKLQQRVVRECLSYNEVSEGNVQVTTTYRAGVLAYGQIPKKGDEDFDATIEYK